MGNADGARIVIYTHARALASGAAITGNSWAEGMRAYWLLVRADSPCVLIVAMKVWGTSWTEGARVVVSGSR